MPHEGMVHALRKAGRLLTADGVLIDIHPTPDPAELEIVRPDGAATHMGPLQSDDARERHANADAALRESVERGMLALRCASTFTFRRYSDSLDELVDYVDRKWTARFDEATLSKTRNTLRSGDILRLREDVAISALRSTTSAPPGAR